MTRFIAGEQITESFVLASRTASETFTVSEASKPDGTAWAGPTITESSGVYTAAGSQSGTETDTGFYSALLTANGTLEVVSLLWEVLTAPAAATRRILPVSTNIEVVQGDSYLNADGGALVWSDTEWPDLTGATATLTIVSGSTTLTITPTIVNAGASTQTVRADLTAAQTAQLRPGRIGGTYNIAAVLSGGGRSTLARGDVRVMGDFP